ncbi:RSP1 [Symbiodinium pilosum]|uniref:RSP1 protein n=1 Tax=Symbiodinium pilosum TaxID=2952 RepID=A0A812SQY0_SYMPI|nr:RSP1 [Symbiodinium pilosum]
MYCAGAKEGHGTFTWSDGAIYKGSLSNNHFHGCGDYRWHDGRRYKGGWEKSKLHGMGRMTWPDGRCYRGYYIRDRKHGEGCFRWPSGVQYSGQWLQGKQHGMARYKYLGGKVRFGRWEDGSHVEWLGTLRLGLSSWIGGFEAPGSWNSCSKGFRVGGLSHADKRYAEKAGLKVGVFRETYSPQLLDV